MNLQEIQEEWEKDLDEQLDGTNRTSAHKNSIFERDDQTIANDHGMLNKSSRGIFEKSVLSPA